MRRRATRPIREQGGRISPSAKWPIPAHSATLHSARSDRSIPHRAAEEGFRTKIARFAFTPGRETIEKCLWLWFTFLRSDTPAWAKSIILGALTYFIVPMDAIPGVAPLHQATRTTWAS